MDGAVPMDRHDDDGAMDGGHDDDLAALVDEHDDELSGARLLDVAQCGDSIVIIV